ncbi:hypothetical protein KC887_07810 [Candidatus Kaiserbacteria bacterium]|nr:hypothetical protein [Candidatus Kaiserbacteria bacterium]
MADTLTQTTLANLSATLSALVENGTRQVVEITDTGTQSGFYALPSSVLNILIRAEASVALDLSNPSAPHPILSFTSSYIFGVSAPAGSTLAFEGIELVCAGGNMNFVSETNAANIFMTNCIGRGASYGTRCKTAGSVFTAENCYFIDFTSYAVLGNLGTHNVNKCTFYSPGAPSTKQFYRGAGVTITNSNIFTGATAFGGSGGTLTAIATNGGYGDVQNITTADYEDYANEVFLAKVGGALDGTGIGGTDIAPSAGSVDSISITSQVSNKILQRNGANQNTATIAGTYTGSPTAIEISVDGGAWATLDAAPSGGTFTGAVTLDVGLHTVDVRWSNNTGVTDGITSLAVGDIYLLVGQSNNDGWGSFTATYTGTAGYCKKFAWSDANWMDFTTDPLTTDSNTGSYFPMLADLIVGNQNIPVGFLAAAKAATVAADWVKGGTYFTRATNLWNAAASGAKAALMWIGESDANAATSEVSFKADMNSIIDDIKADFGLDTILIKISQSAAAEEVNIRQWLTDLAGSNANAIEGPNMWDVFQSTHYVTLQNGTDAAQAVYDTLSPLYYQDTTPDAFSFTDQTDVAVSTLTTSNTVTITGIDTATAISVTGGEMSINSGAFTSSSTTVSVNDTVQLRVTSSASNSTAVAVTLDVGGVTDEWSVTTVAASVGTITTGPFKNNTGTPQTGLTGLRVVVLDPTDGTTVLNSTGNTTHATTAVLTLSDAALTPATTYGVITLNTAGTTIGTELITAT